MGKILIAMAMFILGSGFESVYAMPLDVRAIYLGVNNIYNEKKIAYLENLLQIRDLNAIVIDYKVGKPVEADIMRNVIKRFKDSGAYIICRQVVFQDSYLAKERPDLALRVRSPKGELWYSGKKSWQRYWVDMASPEVLRHNIEVAKRGLDAGCEEINFDYIRFPTDGPTEIVKVEVKGKMQDRRVSIPISYPIWDKKTTAPEILEKFYAGLRRELKAHKPDVVMSIDIYGKVYQQGFEPAVAQDLLTIVRYFDVVSPMCYPSHYGCEEFKVGKNPKTGKNLYVDPNTIPGRVYDETLAAGNKILEVAGVTTILRPWIQDFSIANIYDCGGVVRYGQDEVVAQISASRRHGAKGIMIWNPSNDYTESAHSLKKKQFSPTRKRMTFFASLF